MRKRMKLGKLGVGVLLALVAVLLLWIAGNRPYDFQLRDEVVPLDPSDAIVFYEPERRSPAGLDENIPVLMFHEPDRPVTSWLPDGAATQMDGCFGGLIAAHEEKVMFFLSTDTSEEMLPLYQQTKFKSYRNSLALLQCEFSLEELWQVYEELMQVSSEHVLAVLLDIERNRVAVVVSAWNGKLQRKLSNAVTHPERCYIWENAAFTLPKVTYLERDAFLEQAGKLQGDVLEKLPLEQKAEVYITNWFAAAPVDSWQIKLLFPKSLGASIKVYGPQYLIVYSDSPYYGKTYDTWGEREERLLQSVFWEEDELFVCLYEGEDKLA